MHKRVFILGTLFGGALGVGLDQQPTSEYRDAQYGFKISPPAFPVEVAPKNRLVARFFALPENQFSANMNVNVQTPGMSLDDFVSVSRVQFQTAGFEILGDRRFTIGDHGAVEWSYAGKIQDLELKFLARAVERGDQIFLITCTGLKDSFDKYEEQFRASLESFAFTN